LNYTSNLSQLPLSSQIDEAQPANYQEQNRTKRDRRDDKASA
jgi:hypothetical protein